MHAAGVEGRRVCSGVHSRGRGMWYTQSRDEAGKRRGQQGLRGIGQPGFVVPDRVRRVTDWAASTGLPTGRWHCWTSHPVHEHAFAIAPASVCAPGTSVRAHLQDSLANDGNVGVSLRCLGTCSGSAPHCLMERPQLVRPSHATANRDAGQFDLLAWSCMVNASMLMPHALSLRSREP